MSFQPGVIGQHEGNLKLGCISGSFSFKDISHCLLLFKSPQLYPTPWVLVSPKLSAVSPNLQLFPGNVFNTDVVTLALSLR